MKIQVQIGGGHPELLKELEAIQERHRADRLRTLASIGLAVMGGHASAVQVSYASAVPDCSVGDNSRMNEFEPVSALPAQQKKAGNPAFKGLVHGLMSSVKSIDN